MSDYSHIVGHQRPRIFHAADSPTAEERLLLGMPPLGALGREVKDLSQVAGLGLDDWQCWVMEQACEVRDTTYYNPYTGRSEPKWAAFEVGLVVSRQSGKGSCLEARELAGLFLFGERLIVHTAHLFPTSIEAFNRILFLIQNTPELDAEVAKVSNTHGAEGILLKSGQRLRFMARQGGSGRGFTGDCLIMDEAMILTSESVGALMPTLSARPNAQIWYAGSAGDKKSTQFGRVRSRAMRGDDPRLTFFDWSINPHNDFCAKDCKLHDRSAPVDRSATPEVRAAQEAELVESYAKANPGLGIRIAVEHVQAEQRSMEDETFLRERLGVGDWPSDGEEWLVIPEEAWQRQTDQHSSIEGSFVLCIDVAPEKRYACISAAGLNGDGVGHVEVTGAQGVYDHRPGVGWVLDAVRGIRDLAPPLAVVLDGAGYAGSFEDDIAKMGIKVLKPTTREVAQACGDFRSGISPRPGESANIVHPGQPPLTRAVAGCDKRDLADMWAWAKKTSAVDISPLVSSTLAMWGFRKLGGGVDPWISYQ